MAMVALVLEDKEMGCDCCCNWIPFDYIFIRWNSLTKADTSFLRSISMSSLSYSVLPSTLNPILIFLRVGTGKTFGAHFLQRSFQTTMPLPCQYLNSQKSAVQALVPDRRQPSKYRRLPWSIPDRRLIHDSSNM
ncbi:MAG: hypothetical protein K0Q81_2033 [Paenibacillus sp.]|nr:hypothetical protein [Paenibacillus sp.]